jgi:hypothetical protein
MFGLVMLVAVGVLLDDLAVHHRKARRPERGRAGRAQNMRTVRGVTYELRLNGRSKTQGWVLTALCDRRAEVYRRHWDRKEAAQKRFSDSRRESLSRLHP